ncbi:MAG TPA: hypothetical protein VK211_11230 [Kamptonema sp.]|nr:hypothetical protein [Kamptonema sp.]
MTRQPHDQFAKQYLAELLTPLGEVNISREVSGETRQIDVWFAPRLQPAADPQTLGLLGKIASRPCLLEPFRNQPSKTEIRNCILKLFSLQSQLQRQARREDDTVNEGELPQLWILATSASVTLLDSFQFKLDLDNWCQGVYFLGEAMKTAIVAINQLPTTPETLWLRILGKGTTQQQAIGEIIALPETNPLRTNVLEQVSIWRVNLQAKQDLTEEDRELIMNLTPAYVQWREETLLQGQQIGLEIGRFEERRIFVENFLIARFGSIDEALLAVVEPMLELPPAELTRILLELSREELLARFENRENQ